MRLPSSIFVLLLLLSGLPLLAATSAADTPHVHVELMAPEDLLYGGAQRNDAGVYFKLEPGWHIYWKNAGDAGQPSHIRWALPEGITAGPMQFPAPQRLPLGPLMDFGYEDEVLFPLKLRVADDVQAGPVTLRATVDWLVCQHSCIPGKAELELQKRVATGLHHSAHKPDPLFARFFDRLPKSLPAKVYPVFQPTKDGFRLTVETGQREKSAVFFPADPEILDNSASQRMTPTANGLVLDIKKDAALTANPARLNGVLELSGGRAFELTALPGTVAAPTQSISANASLAPSQKPVPAPAPLRLKPAGAPLFSWIALLRASGLAFLGGLLLNLMPCVFPVLFLKGLALARSGHHERHRLRAHGLVYTAGILISFWALVAVLLGLRAAGATLGWGFQFQSPIFLELMAGLLFFLGLSLVGQFEIGLTLTGAGGSFAAKTDAAHQGYTGSFFTGVLAVVVATPCTAPFMGAAVGYALAQSAAVVFAVFTALALGLAAPYLALTLQPAWTHLLPRPGVWMVLLRRAVSVPIFATVVWLAWVLARAYGTSILAVLLVSFLLLAIAGWFLGRWPARRWSAVVAALILLEVVALAVVGQKLAGVNAGKTSQEGRTNPDSVATNGWEPWSAEAVSRYRAQGRPVFVDFTASWCLSCQVNERGTLERPQVQQAFRAGNVALLRADWTRHDEAITQALAGLGRGGVPAYALFVPGEKRPRLLPELLTPGLVLDALGKLPKTASTLKR